jgi:hypothetical protein
MIATCFKASSHQLLGEAGANHENLNQDELCFIRMRCLQNTIKLRYGLNAHAYCCYVWMQDHNKEFRNMYAYTSSNIKSMINTKRML